MRSGGGHARGNSAAGVVPAAAAAALPSRPVIGGHRDRWSRYVRQVRPRQSGRDGSEPNYRDDLTSDRDPTSCPGRARRARVASASLVDARADVPHTARGSSRRDRGAGETHQQRRGACRRKDRRIAGFAALLPLDGGACELDALFVEPNRMRSGVGSALIDDARRVARDRGAERIDVVANPQAVAFYQPVGFTTCGRVGTRFGPAPRMTLALGRKRA